jgi:hypothetical protein
MEIHAPHGPARSFRDFLLQLLTITCGVLIALSFEGIVQWRHHRQLARESADNLAREIRANRDGLENGLGQMDTTQLQLRSILAVVHKIQEDRASRPKPDEATLSISVMSLRETAWNTAGGTGALGFMAYRDVTRYTRIYNLQHQFMDVQRRSLDALLELESYGPLLQGSYRRISDAQGIEAERAVGRAQAATRAAQSVGKALDAAYGEFLGGK